MTYDLAILACERKDSDCSTNAIRLLQEAMRFAGPGEVRDLLSLYDWCLARIQEGEYAPAVETLRGLRDSWKRAEQRLNSLASSDR